MDKKWFIGGIAVITLIIFGRVLFGCAQQAGVEEYSFVKEMAQSLATQSKNSSNNAATSGQINTQSVKAGKVIAQQPQLGTPDADGWYSITHSGMPAGMTAKIRFYYSAGTSGRYWLYESELRTLSPDYIETDMSGNGLFAGETVHFHGSQDWSTSNYGTVTPSVYVINTTAATYAAETKDAISLAGTSRMTGVGTVTATGAGTHPSGTMSINQTMYLRRSEEKMIYGTETISGTMTDSQTGTSHAVSGSMTHLLVSNKEWMYGTMEDATNGLVGIMNINLTDSSGYVLDMMQTPWKVYTITIGGT